MLLAKLLKLGYAIDKGMQETDFMESTDDGPYPYPILLFD